MGFYIGYEADIKRLALSKYSLKWIMTEKYINKYFSNLDLYDVYSPYYEYGKAHSHKLLYIGTIIEIIFINDIKLRLKNGFPLFVYEYIESEIKGRKCG